MIPGSLARRYARALVGLATSPAQRDRFDKDITAFAEIVAARDENGTQVLAILTNDRFRLEQRQGVVDAILRKLGADPMVGKFLAYVLRRGRMVGVAQIARAYRRMADEAAGRVRATITAARPLAAADQSALTQALQQATGKQVLAETQVDPEIIGGVVTQIGSYVIDSSVRAHLARMRASLHHDG